MNRDLVINILLILAGIVLAIALFGDAGVLWKSKAPTKTSGLVKPQASETANNDCYWIASAFSDATPG